MTRWRGRMQKKERFKPKAVPRVKKERSEPVDPRAVEGRSLSHRGRALVSERSKAWRRLDRLRDS